MYRHSGCKHIFDYHGASMVLTDGKPTKGASSDTSSILVCSTTAGYIKGRLLGSFPRDNGSSPLPATMFPYFNRQKTWSLTG